MSTSQEVAFDVSEATFEQDVVERSHTVAVVVDFWAAWCGPCRTLGPVLEQAVAARGGEVVLAKVDVDRNPALAASFGIRGIPAVKAFVDGAVVAEFTGAQGPRQVAAFLDGVVPSEADRAARAGAELAAAGDERGARQAFDRALRSDPGHRVAAVGLAALLVDHDPERARELIGPHRPHPDAEVVADRLRLREGADDIDRLRRDLSAATDDGAIRIRLGRALAASGRFDEALDEILAVVAQGGAQRDAAREEVLSILRVLGDDDPRVADARRRLANALF